MSMHKGMCGRTESDNGPATTLGQYLQAKYPEEMKRKLTFEEWYDQYYPFSERNWPDDARKDWARDAWQASRENI